MAVSAERYSVLLQFLHHFEANTTPFGIKSQHQSQHSRHAKATLETQTRYFFFLRSSEEKRQLLQFLHHFEANTTSFGIKSQHQSQHS